MIRFLFLLGLIATAPALFARDVFVMLSGGVSPFENNYSQYLQARAVNAFFEKNYPRDSVWTFFGAGNVEGEKPLIADVRRKVERDDSTVDTWLPGVIPHNRSATRKSVLLTFEQEILPAVAGGGTLFLFVGDHGSQARGDGESEIDLWELKRDAQGPRGWGYETNSALGVADFRRILMARIGKGRLVFCMTQCHAGGFHALAVPEQMSPNPRWFSRAPEWLAEATKTSPTLARAAGFTATDQFSAAAGCMADPDEKNWAGYERFIPENLLGMDLFTRESKRDGLRSFAEAHVAATLQDFTIDKPSASSDEFLERWAALLESRLSGESQLTSRVRTALTAYRRTVDGAWSVASDPAYRERQKLFAQFIEKMSEQSPQAKMLLVTGTRKQLEEAMGAEHRRVRGLTARDSSTQTNRPPRRPRGGSGPSAENRKLWREAIRPVWAKAVESGAITNRIALPLEFERHLLKLETEKNRVFLNGGRQLEEEGFWFSGYGNPETVDATRAEAVARWTQERRSTLLEWAVASDDDEVRAAGMKISLRRRGSRAPTAPAPGEETEVREELSAETAAERTLFYRRVLGAWEFLLAVNERPALARLRELIELERTPLPPAGK